MYRIAMYEVGMSSPVGEFFNLPTLPMQDTFIQYESRTWRVVGVMIFPPQPGSRQYGTDAPVLAEVTVMEGNPAWRPKT